MAVSRVAGVPRPAARRAGEYLDKATVVRVAGALADEVGWSKLTLSLLAKRVERHVTTLYAHVDSLDALRREVALMAIDELSDTVWKAALARTRDDALRAIAEVYRSFALRRPGCTSAIAAGFDPADEEYRTRAARLAEPVQATFRSFGLDEHAVVVAHRIFSALIRGLVVDPGADVRLSAPERDATFDQAIALFVAGIASGSWPKAGPDSGP